MKKVILFLAVGLCIAAAAAGCFFWKEKKDAQEELTQDMQLRSSITLETVQQAEAPLSKVPVDFSAWQEDNSDIYAWITIPGTDIDDPVLQSAEDDGWYLERDENGTESIGGSIYSEQRNAKDFSDMLTVLYGRSTVEGGKFTDLLKYEDELYLKAHNLILICMPDRVLYYQIFAAYRYDDRHLLQSFDCSEQAVYETYINGIFEQRNLYACIDESVQPNWPDRILTLSTGHPSGSEWRYLIQAVCIREQTF